jgi:hypothetical protein
MDSNGRIQDAFKFAPFAVAGDDGEARIGEIRERGTEDLFRIE